MKQPQALIITIIGMLAATQPGAILAQDGSDPVKCQSLSPEQRTEFNHLSTEQVIEKYGDCPASVVWSQLGAPGERAAFLDIMPLLHAQTLARQGYGLLDEENILNRAPIREWQRENGHDPTGELTIAQVSSADLLEPEEPMPDVFLSSNNWEEDRPDIYRNGGFVSIKGSWWIDADTQEDRIAYPLNQSVIDCRLAENTCTEASVIMFDATGGGLSVALDMERLTIVSADNTVLTLSRGQGLVDCRRSEISVNFARQTVFEITTSAGDCPEGFELSAPRIARLRSSAIQSQEVRRSNDESAFRKLSPRLQARYQSLGQAD